MPIYQTSVYSVPDISTGELIQSGQTAGYVYARNAHPNAAALEAAVAELEGADAALASASGMGAIFAVLFSLLGPGAHMVCTDEPYGGTMLMVEADLRRWGAQISYVDTTDAAAVAAALRPETRVVYVETISNPTVRLVDLPALAELCRQRGIVLVVDNTFASPALCRPIEHGATISVNSATKYLGGHSDLMAGVAAGPTDLIAAARKAQVRTGGMVDPFAAWLCMRGIRTLGLRMERQSRNALGLAHWLQQHPKVSHVNYPGLPDHPQHHLVSRLLPQGAGPMLSFAAGQGLAGANTVIAGLKLAQFLPSLGDVTTTVSHPMSTSHRAMTPEQRAALGIGDNLIRVNVGAEGITDIIADFEQALAAI